MYFPDLDPCRYGNGPLDAGQWAVPLRAVGWLGRPHPFAIGSVSRDFRDRFTDLSRQMGQCFAQYTFRGLHVCDLCVDAGVQGGSAIEQSEINVLVPGDGEVFAATGGLLHYATAHSYLPPRAFIDAVMACPPCDSPEYLDALRAANSDVAPPLETFEMMLERSRRERAAAQRFRNELGRPLKDATRAQVVAAAARAWPDAQPPGERGDVDLGDSVAQFDESGRFMKFAHE